jgi:PAS domain S-box-containing protein
MPRSKSAAKKRPAKRRKAMPAKALQARPAPARPAPAKPARANPVGAKPVRFKPVGAKPVRVKPVGAKPVRAKPVGAKPTAAKRADPEAALIAERLEDVTRLASDWIWETDAELAITYLSARVVEALGRHPRELIGRSLLELGEFERENGEPAPLSPRRRTPFRDLPFILRHRDGSTRVFLVSSLPMFSARTGEFRGFRGTARDVTELRERESALLAAKEMAEIASRSKSEFLANISHELRTPLNAIIGFSEIMRDQIFGPIGSPQYREYLGDVLESAHHLLELINDILDLAKAEAGKLELAEEQVDVAAVVRATVRLVRERAQRAGLELSVNAAEGLPIVHADERKLKQILLNLLSNAVKFTGEGGAIAVAAGLDARGDLILSVTDSGIGIAPGDLALALAPFGQVEGSLNRKHEGTGLGLPLSRAMAELHGGELTLESTFGKGTTVRVRLPASRVVREPSAAAD